MVKNTCFLTSFDGHILSQEERTGNVKPYGWVRLMKYIWNRQLLGKRPNSILNLLITLY